MWHDAPVSSTSTSRMALQALGASWAAKMREHFVVMGMGGYIAVWIAFPLFTMATAGLVYRGHRPELLAYAVVGVAASTFISNALYYIGQILDEERIEGTLVGLFLTPCPRLGWLTGFALGGLFETAIAAATVVVFARIAFGVTFDPDYAALLLSFVLFMASLWGLGFVFSAIGLILKRSNDLANLLSSFVFLLGGIFYPIALLPVWLRYPAEVLPLGYGVQAMASAALHHRSIASLGDQLIPLTGFALVLPVLGVLSFSWLERKVRQHGELDLY